MSTLETIGFVPRSKGRKEPLQLAMQSLWLTGRVLPMGARLWIRHEFESQEAKPVEVVYGFGLPRDAALRRFRITGEGFSVNSELRPVEEARKIYESGIQAGSLSTMAREYGDGLINLSVGNLRLGERVVVLLEIIAGVELHDDGLRLRFPFTLAPSYHSKARALEIESGVGELELPQEDFGDLILPKFVEDARRMHSVGFHLELHFGDGTQEIASPSHTLRVETGTKCTKVGLARESDLPDRDLVLDVRKKTRGTAVFSGIDQEGKGRLAVVVPSTEFGPKPEKSRRLVILLDRSGSMGGVPITRAKKAIEACLAALDESDRFGLVAFDNKAEVFKEDLAEANKKNREQAREFLEKIDARGGTELAQGLETAAKLLTSQGWFHRGEADPGDILVLTDGQVFSTESILERARATKARVHCLGIGSASQDRFLAHLAAHTGGVSRFLTPNERVDMAALELFSAIGLPVAEQLRASINGIEGGRVVSEVPKHVFSGTPLLVHGETPKGADASLHLEWQNRGADRQCDVPVRFVVNQMGNTLKLFQGARLISDYESRHDRRPAARAEDRREADRVREGLVRLSQEYGLASSEVALVAVVKRAGDVEGELPKVVVVPVGMPQDTNFIAVFGAPPTAAAFTSVFRGGAHTLGAPAPPMPRSTATGTFETGAFTQLFGRQHKLDRVSSPAPADIGLSSTRSPEDVLVALVGLLEPDGGMPGKTAGIRIANSLGALLFLLSEGNSTKAGPFRMHVAKMLRFLQKQDLAKVSDPNRAIAFQLLQVVVRYLTPDLKCTEIAQPLNLVKSDWLLHAETLVKSEDVDQNRFWPDAERSIKTSAPATERMTGTS